MEIDGSPESTYGYDANSNRTSYDGQFGTVLPADVTVDTRDRLLAYDDLTFTYTDAGELLTKTQAGQTIDYHYDVFGNLRTVDLPGGTEIEYVTDGANRRIGKKIDGTLVQGFLYQDTLNPIAELDGSGNVVSRFVYATRANVPDYMVTGGVTYRIVADHLGSVRLVVDVATGFMAQELRYDEFGRVTLDTSPGFQPFGFAGGINDSQTGLVRFGARDYDPQTGRWTAPDRLRFQSGEENFFEYSRSNPVNFKDRTGFDDVTDDEDIQDCFYCMLENTGHGWFQWEDAAWVVEDSPGDFSCDTKGWETHQDKARWPGGPRPKGIAAFAHTHPTRAKKKSIPEPSEPDKEAARKEGKPVYTITPTGIWKFDPATGQTTQEAPKGWTKAPKKRCKGGKCKGIAP